MNRTYWRRTGLLAVAVLMSCWVLEANAQNGATTGQTGVNAGKEEAAPTESQILQIFITANAGEVMTSEPATQKGTDEVKAFAQKMVQEHARVLQQAQALSTQAELDPEANLVSQSLQNSAQGTAEKLNGLADPAVFSETYMTAQIHMHQQTLDMLDFTLIPHTQNELLAGLLQEARDHVVQHLDEAKQIYRNLKQPETGLVDPEN